MKFNTSLLHTVKPEDKHGATLPPIYQVSAFASDSAEQLEKIFNNRAAGFSYTRAGNPTVDAFERRVAALEGGIGAVACASGMAAITGVLLNILQSLPVTYYIHLWQGQAVLHLVLRLRAEM